MAKLAEEHSQDIQLVCGIFEMSAANIRGVETVLNKYNINCLPEAHCYLIANGHRYDFTRVEAPISMELEILEENIFLVDELAVKKQTFIIHI